MSSMRIFAILLVGGCVLAADEPTTPERPKSPPAVAAFKEYDKAMHDAEAAYRKAQATAEYRLIDKLKIAMTSATRAGNLPEANAIDAQINAAAARIEAPKAAPEPALAITGRWSIRFSNGNARTYEWLADGRVAFVESKLVSPLRREGNALIVDFGDGKLERVTMADGKLKIDHFEPADTFPDGQPFLTAVGVRIPEVK